MKAPRKTVLPPSSPTLAETYGSVKVGHGATLMIEYKNMTLLVDPAIEVGGGPNTLDGLNFSFPFDYLLLTDTQPRHFDEAAKSRLRKNLKVLTTVDGASAVSAAGFSNVKGLSNTQKMTLKKEDAFLFAGAWKSAPSTNGYLLEFGNGRNIFIAGEADGVDSLREFLYTLRDDGKEIHLAFVYGRPIANTSEQSRDKELSRIADLIALLQPKIAAIIQSEKLDDAALVQKLVPKLFYGQAYQPSPGDKIPF